VRTSRLLPQTSAVCFLCVLPSVIACQGEWAGFVASCVHAACPMQASCRVCLRSASLAISRHWLLKLAEDTLVGQHWLLQAASCRYTAAFLHHFLSLTRLILVAFQSVESSRRMYHTCWGCLQTFRSVGICAHPLQSVRICAWIDISSSRHSPSVVAGVQWTLRLGLACNGRRPLGHALIESDCHWLAVGWTAGRVCGQSHGVGP
jgi:hypothetical protein